MHFSLPNSNGNVQSIGKCSIEKKNVRFHCELRDCFEIRVIYGFEACTNETILWINNSKTSTNLNLLHTFQCSIK